MHRNFNERESTFDTRLYGRRLHEDMVAYWPNADENLSAPKYEIEYARIWKTKKKIVFSNTLTHLHRGCRLFNGSNAGEIRKLKAQADKNMTVGGANLASTFIRLGLVAEYQVSYIRLFSETENRCFRICRTGSS